MLKRLMVFNPRSVREVKKYLKPPLASVSTVIYYAGDGVVSFPQEGTMLEKVRSERKLHAESVVTNEMLGKIVVFTRGTCKRDEATVPEVPEKILFKG